MECYKCGRDVKEAHLIISVGKYLCDNCYIKDQQMQIENMKCCGNCGKNVQSHFNNGKEYNMCAGDSAENCCPDWVYDGITSEQR